jgi:hypothetical protein
MAYMGFGQPCEPHWSFPFKIGCLTLYQRNRDTNVCLTSGTRIQNLKFSFANSFSQRDLGFV